MNVFYGTARFLVLLAFPALHAAAQQTTVTWQAELESETTEGALDATSPTYATIGIDGHLFVSDADNLHVLIIDSTSAIVGRMGRNGEGPGEFRSLRALGVLRPYAWAYDARLGRVTTIDARGKALKVVRLPQSIHANEGGGGSFRLLALMIESRYVGESGPDRASLTGWAKERPKGTRALVVVDSTGNLARVLGWVSPNPCTKDFPFAGAVTPLPVVFCTPPTTAASADGATGAVVEDLAHGRKQGIVRVRAVDTRTGNAVIRDVMVDRAPVTQAERDSAVSSILRQLPAAPELRREYSEQRVVEYKPGYRSVMIDNNRRVWLKVQQTATEGYRLLGIHGRDAVIVQVLLDPGVEPLAVDGQTLWAVRRDGRFEPVVQRYRLRPE